MKKVIATLSAHKYAIIWTLCYTAFVWLVLRFLFNFNIFSGLHWHLLLHAKLRGFPGFVFGIFILAALPLYIATTTLIIRTKKPLFSVSVPKYVKKTWENMQPTLINPPAPEPEEKKAQEAPEEKKEPDPTQNLPEELPAELRTMYIRARKKIEPEQQSAFNYPMKPTPIAAQPNIPTPQAEIDEIPLPTDFDFEPDNSAALSTDNFANISAPTFSEITFDRPQNNTNPISEYLNSANIPFETTDDIIVTEKHAIAVHTDPDFWVCDDTSWFATGKQIDSPIKKLIDITAHTKAIPVLYLDTDNIMDLDKMRDTWETMGITVITTPSELPE